MVKGIAVTVVVVSKPAHTRTGKPLDLEHNLMYNIAKGDLLLVLEAYLNLGIVILLKLVGAY